MADSQSGEKAHNTNGPGWALEREEVRYVEELLRPEVRVEMAGPEVQVQEGDK